MDTSQILRGLGIATASYTTLRFLRFIYLYTRPSSINRYNYGGNPWALITGASDGIGFGISQELATSGFNVILHGRNPEKLERAKIQLDGECKNVQVRTALLNASSATSQQIDGFVAGLDGLNLTVLVNNVGGGSKIQALEKHTAEELDSLMNVNARFPAQLTRSLMSRLAKTDGPTLIMNICSLADSCVPYATVYGGSKAFNMAMSSSLAVEVETEGKHIEVLAIPVGRVTDVAHSKEPSSFFTPTARIMAKACVDRVGCGRRVVIGHVGHAMQKFVIDLFPSIVFEMLVVPTMKARKEKEERKKL